MKKFVITFAGPIGSSKTPVTYYLSQRLSLPIINNDSIRTEVTEDLTTFSEEEFRNRVKARLGYLFESGKSFIYDASMDRKWEKVKEALVENGYEWFLISMDFEKGFLSEIYKAKGYEDSLKMIDENCLEHEKFLEEFSKDIGLHLKQEDFKDRLEISYNAVKNWLR